MAGGIPTEREEWRPIAWAPEYAVSSHGRIMRLAATSGTRACKILKPYVNVGGYCRTSLRSGGRKIDVKVHRLVCEAFYGPAPADKPITRHLDGNPSNNHISNLVWGTAKENVADKYRHGTANDPPGLAERRAQTHCWRGHEFTEENTAIYSGGRHCKACATERVRQWRAARAGA